jgi:hypothetical protein
VRGRDFCGALNAGGSDTSARDGSKSIIPAHEFEAMMMDLCLCKALSVISVGYQMVIWWRRSIDLLD